MVEYSEIDPLEDLKPGDQIAIKGLFKDIHESLHVLYPIFSKKDYYYHHGIYMGNNTVVHFHGDTKMNARVCETKLWLFLQGAADKHVYRIDHNRAKILPVNETLRRAEMMVNPATRGEREWPEYNIVWNNCETLATWMKTDEKLSYQASEAMIHGVSTVARSVAVGSQLAVDGITVGGVGTAILGSIAMSGHSDQHE